MKPLLLLAAASETTSSPSGPLIDVNNLVDYFWGNITGLSWMMALLIISVGVVYMLYGWRIFRVLVTISFGFLGMFIGIFAGRHLGSIILGGIIGTA
jgi:hypothetical protein